MVLSAQCSVLNTPITSPSIEVEFGYQYVVGCTLPPNITACAKYCRCRSVVFTESGILRRTAPDDVRRIVNPVLGSKREEKRKKVSKLTSKDHGGKSQNDFPTMWGEESAREVCSAAQRAFKQSSVHYVPVININMPPS